MTLLNIFTSIDLSLVWALIVAAVGFLGGMYVDGKVRSTKQADIRADVDENKEAISKFQEDFSEVKAKADEVYKYKEDSEKDRKQVMEQDMPMLKSTLLSINDNLSDMKDEINQIKVENARMNIKYERIFSTNTNIKRPSES